MASITSKILSHPDNVFFASFDNVTVDVNDLPTSTTVDDDAGNSSVIIHSTYGYQTVFGNQPSLSDSDVIGKSLCLLKNGRVLPNPSSIQPYTFLEVPHCPQFGFDTQGQAIGDFTIEAMLIINSSPGYYNGTTTIYDFTEKTLFEKTGIIDVTYTSSYGVPEYLKIKWPNGVTTTDTIGACNIGTNNVFHIVIRWSDTGTYYKGSLFVNGYAQQHKDTYTGNHIVTNGVHTTAYVNANAPASLYVLGRPSTVSPTTNAYKMTATAYIDYLAVYNSALDDFTIYDHFVSMYLYNTALQKSLASAATMFEDTELDNHINMIIGSRTSSNLYGSYVKNNGPMFKSGSSVSINQGVFTWGAGFGADSLMYADISVYSAGTILHSRGTTWPYGGFTLDVKEDGTLELFKDVTGPVPGLQYPAATNMLDGNSHNIAVAYNNDNELVVYVDGVAHITTQSTTRSGSIVFGAGQSSSVNMRISNFVLYQRSVPLELFRNLINKTRYYSIYGRVTLTGNATQAIVRAYDFGTGELVAETISEQNNGDYSLTFMSNRKIMLLFIDDLDDNVKSRVIGPVTPV